MSAPNNVGTHHSVFFLLNLGIIHDWHGMILQGLVLHEQKLLKDYLYFCIILHVNHLHGFEKFRVKFSWVVKNDCQAIVLSDMTVGDHSWKVHFLSWSQRHNLVTTSIWRVVHLFMTKIKTFPPAEANMENINVQRTERKVGIPSTCCWDKEETAVSRCRVKAGRETGRTLVWMGPRWTWSSRGEALSCQSASYLSERAAGLWESEELQYK